MKNTRIELFKISIKYRKYQKALPVSARCKRLAGVSRLVGDGSIDEAFNSLLTTVADRFGGRKIGFGGVASLTETKE